MCICAWFEWLNWYFYSLLMYISCTYLVGRNWKILLTYLHFKHIGVFWSFSLCGSFLYVGGPKWAPHTPWGAWRARRSIGSKAKTKGQILPLLSKTRELHVTKRGNLEPQFEFQVQELHEGHPWKENEEPNEESTWENESSHVFHPNTFPIPILPLISPYTPFHFPLHFLTYSFRPRMKNTHTFTK